MPHPTAIRVSDTEAVVGGGSAETEAADAAEEEEEEEEVVVEVEERWRAVMAAESWGGSFAPMIHG